jgi:hypothetical protein
MNKNKIDKIKKLLAKADKSANNCEEEASLAMKMAMEMMDSEGISFADIQASSMEDELGELGESILNGTSKKYLNWEKILSNALGYFFDCSTINNRVTSYKSERKIIGRESNRITCEIFYNWIYDKAMKEAKELYHVQTAKRNSYCLGVANAIQKKVFELKPMSKSTTPNAWGIVPIDEVLEFMRKKYPDLKDVSYSYSVSDDRAYSAGKKSGEGISLNRQFGLQAIA